MTVSTKRRWSPADKELLATLANSGVPRHQMAQMLGRTEHAIACALEKMRRTDDEMKQYRAQVHQHLAGYQSASLTSARRRRTSWTIREDRLLRDMRAAGLSNSEIAVKLGRTYYAVVNRFRVLKGE